MSAPWIRWVQLALAALPDSPDAIAALLAERGCTGYMGSPTLCPIAMWIRAHVDGEAVLVPHVARRVATVSGVRFQLSSAADNFVARFDAGRYPELRRYV